MDLSNFFSAAEACMDRWSQLNTTARSLESAVKAGRPAEQVSGRARFDHPALQPRRWLSFLR
jgi:hypothetical protein